MTKYIVQGGKPLFGEVEISGAKNAAVAIIPAALLVDGVCRIENIPQISDVTLCLKILEDLGVTEIEAKGQTFDPNRHNAVMHIEDEQYGENEVVQVFQTGFMLGDKVLRYAFVQVAN